MACNPQKCGPGESKLQLHTYAAVWSVCMVQIYMAYVQKRNTTCEMKLENKFNRYIHRLISA